MLNRHGGLLRRRLVLCRQEGGKTVEQTYCTPFMGYPFYSRDDSVHNPYYNQDLPPQRGFYRWHIPDPST